MFSQAICTVTCFTVNITSLSSYIGVIFYINGMVNDMKMRFNSNDDENSPRNQSTDKLPVYIDQIKFHNEIIKYLSLISANSFQFAFYKKLFFLFLQLC